MLRNFIQSLVFLFCFVPLVFAQTSSTSLPTTHPLRPEAEIPLPGNMPKSTKLLRYPDIRADRIVFCHSGDLWTLTLQPYTGAAQQAVRLTAHEGLELFPKFSPDGRWIAFTGQYDGDEQVYVIPAEGGQPRQLTFYPAGGPLAPRHGYDNIVYGWTPDGKSVLFRSLRDANSVTELGTLYTVSLDGGGPQGALPVKVGMPTAGSGSFSPDGSMIVYSPLFRDFRSWKRYEGGWAQYLTIFDLKTRQTKRLDNDRRTQREPIWIGNKIYFVSDRTGTMNLYEYDIATERIIPCTSETVWDVRWASGDKASGLIVFELGGELYVYDTKNADRTQRLGKLVIEVPHDGLAMRPARINASKNIESFETAPKGKQIAMIARGDLFTLPVDKGFVRNRSNSSNAHERCPAWSQDGKRVAYISDASGEDQLYLLDLKSDDATEPKPVQLTTDFKGQLDHLRYSPCGRFLSVSDCKAKLHVVAIDGFGQYQKGVPVEVTRRQHGGTPVGRWSPCGNYLAYTLSQAQGFTSLHIWDVDSRTERTVGDLMFDVDNPVWDPSGKYLYYLSRREFAPQFSSVEWNFAGNRDVGIFALALQKDTPNLFGPQFGDEDDSEKDTGKDKSKGKDTEKDDNKDDDNSEDSKKKDKKVEPTKIDWDGLADRVVRVPVSSENYSSLNATDKFLLYIKKEASFYGRDPSRKPRLMIYDLKKRKESQLADAVDAYSLAPDFTKIVFRSDKKYKSCDVKTEAKAEDVKTDHLYVDRIPAEEWAEIFDEVWRKYRDHFYVDNMHGYDWVAIGRQYRSLLPHVAHRSDLNYIISEMIGELNVGHAYIQGGDYVQPKRPQVGLPGCRFEFDSATDRYRIAKIFNGENAEPKYRSPLMAVGVDAREGDYVLAIDGIELTGKDNPYRILQHRKDPVALTLNTQPNFDGARKIVYEPIFTERSLRYLDFVQRCRETVDKTSGGRVGYLHIPDMGAPGAYEFLKWYYPQIRKEGLVVDVRSNGGGNISQWIIMRLNQKLLGTRFGGVKESPAAYPGNARHGHQVCLISETSASDGDIFPHYFRKSGLGPLIGKRSWGGVVGISPRGQLLDGGTTSVPLMATNDENGEWIIEGEGVSPDIEVDNDPKSMIEGHDPQLERGIAEVLRLIQTSPTSWPTRPADPVKTK